MKEKIPPIIVQTETGKEAVVVVKIDKDDDHDVLIRLETTVGIIGENVRKLNNKIDKPTFMWVIGGICAVLIFIVGYLIVFRGDIVSNKVLLQEIVKSHKVISMPIDKR